MLVRQARQESNLQPPVLETGTLPIELLAYTGHRLDSHPATVFPLLGLPVHRVLAAAGAEFLQFHPAGIVAAVLLRCIVTLFALSAGERDDRADIFFLRSHFTSSYTH